MRIAVTGANGQVGRELRLSCARAGHQMIAFDRTVLDLTNEIEIHQIASSGIDGVINAAAYTGVDAAETDESVAEAVNANAPGLMARICAEHAIPMVHYSTDYVFDGTGRRPYVERDETRPLGVYGRTKRAGEEAVVAAGGVSAVIRLSWVFSAHGRNFVKTMLRLGAERQHVRVVSDQIGKPTPAAAAADAGVAVLEALGADRSKSGIYHFAGDEATSWAGFAEAIFSAADMNVSVEPITTEAYPTPASRPAWSVLDTSLIEATFGISAADWRTALNHVIDGLGREEQIR